MTPLIPKAPDEGKQALYKQWVEHIQQHGVGLTEWEDEFIDSVAGQIDAGRYLSETQGERIEDIYTKRTP